MSETKPKPHPSAGEIVTAADAIKALIDGRLWTTFKTTHDEALSRDVQAFVRREQFRALALTIEGSETKVRYQVRRNNRANLTEHTACVVVLHPAEAAAIIDVLDAFDGETPPLAPADARDDGLPEWVVCVDKPTICGRDVGNAFVFQGLEHALQAHMDESRLVPCPHCLARAMVNMDVP